VAGALSPSQEASRKRTGGHLTLVKLLQDVDTFNLEIYGFSVTFIHANSHVNDNQKCTSEFEFNKLSPSLCFRENKYCFNDKN
jgi:hypothetical protein